ncbi:peroxiredoxin-like family protein [Pseudomonas sp. RC10]|uniref:peroxiredoxin-like family protein n=1 Tax=Pseudomonas bambusae TaxID=3139142 RepID=UPI00313A34FA
MLDIFKQELQAGEPSPRSKADITALIEEATNRLVASGAGKHALKVGDRAPDFELSDADCNPIRSSDLLARGALVLQFHRGAWCPYCNFELQSLQSFVPLFRNLRANVVAISPQTPTTSRKSIQENAVTFPILSDLKNVVAGQFGLNQAIPEYLHELYHMLDVSPFAEVGSHSNVLPIPARYVIAEDGVIVHADINPGYTQRIELLDLLPALCQAATRSRLAPWQNSPVAG